MNKNKITNKTVKQYVLSEIEKMNKRELARLILLIDSHFPVDIIKKVIASLSYSKLYNFLYSHNISLETFKSWVKEKEEQKEQKEQKEQINIYTFDNANLLLISAQKKRELASIKKLKDKERKEREERQEKKNKEAKKRKDKPTKEEISQEHEKVLLEKVDLEHDVFFDEVDFSEARKAEKKLEAEAGGEGKILNKPYVTVEIKSEDVPKWFSWILSLLIKR
jgi:hypothetical protein